MPSAVHRYQKNDKVPEAFSHTTECGRSCQQREAVECKSIRVLIPKKLCARVLKELHRGPAGVVCMKQLAHSHVWWPGIDAHTVRACEACQQYCKAPPAAPLHGCHGTTFMWISWAPLKAVGGDRFPFKVA